MSDTLPRSHSACKAPKWSNEPVAIIECPEGAIAFIRHFQAMRPQGVDQAHILEARVPVLLSLSSRTCIRG